MPKGVWFQKKRRRSGEFVRYGYFGRGPGTVALGLEGSPKFFSNLAQVLEREPASHTVANLIWRYRQSPEFAKLRSRTRSDYEQQLGKIQMTFGALSLKAMESRAVVQHIFAWRDGMAASPRRADYAIQVLTRLLSWSVKRGLMDQNRAAGIGRLYKGDRSEMIWTVEQVDAFCRTAPEPLVRALTLALETGQRQADLLRLSWSAVDGDVVSLRQRKWDAPASVPISERLRKCLGAAPRGNATTILTKEDGNPWDSKGNGFRNSFRTACGKAGVKGVTFHDLRGTFVTRRFEDGWTAEEIALCTGHSLRDLASLERYVGRTRVSLANAKRVGRRSSGSDREQNLQTDLQTERAIGR
jgi:integrase